MNSKIELHDSVLAEVGQDSHWVQLQFDSVYIHRSEGRPGVDPGTGWEQPACLHISQAVMAGVFPELPCPILDGQWWIGGRLHENSIPLPFIGVGKVKLHLTFDSRPGVSISGEEARLELFGIARHIDDFPGAM